MAQIKQLQLNLATVAMLVILGYMAYAGNVTAGVLFFLTLLAMKL